MNKWILPSILSVLAVGSVSFALNGQAGEIASPIFKTGEWFRISVTLLSIALAAYVLYRNRTDKALTDTVRILQDEIKIHNQVNDRLRRDNAEMEKVCNGLRAEVKVLETRTDMSKVLEALHQSNSLGEKRYTEAMKALSEGQAATLKQAEANFNLLQKVLELAEKRWR